MQQITRLWPHDGQHAFGRCHIGDRDAVRVLVAHQPRLIRQPRGGRGDDKVGIGREPRDGDVGLNPGAVVEELGVDDLAHGHRIIAACDIVQERLCIRSLDANFAER